jgi:hypothetical protein
MEIYLSLESHFILRKSILNSRIRFQIDFFLMRIDIRTEVFITNINESFCTRSTYIRMIN